MAKVGGEIPHQKDNSLNFLNGIQGVCIGLFDCLLKVILYCNSNLISQRIKESKYSIVISLCHDVWESKHIVYLDE